MEITIRVKLIQADRDLVGCETDVEFRLVIAKVLDIETLSFPGREVAAAFRTGREAWAAYR